MRVPRIRKRPRATRGWWICAFLALGLAFAGGARGEIVTLSGEYGHEKFVARNLAPGTLVDARGARFRVGNSKNSSPGPSADCKTGPLPDNPYPLRIYDSPSAVLIGGEFDGEVPQDSDWEYTSCGSAAVRISDSPNSAVEGVRARRVSDGVRFSRQSPLFKLDEAWLSDARGDCVQNDSLRSGLIKDVLLDGCFAGINVRASGEGTEEAPGETVTLAGVLMRLQPYLYKGKISHGAPLKVDQSSPAFQIYDSVFAITGAELVSRKQFAIGWEKITDCRNNMLLWISDMPWPGKHMEPPSCFRVVQGELARSLWESVRQNWINCHFSSTRFTDDPVSDPLACDTAFYGGQY
jgi:hypothetical protein